MAAEARSAADVSSNIFCSKRKVVSLLMRGLYRLEPKRCGI